MPCSDCFTGLKKQLVPDLAGRRRPVISMDEALSLERANSGSWVPNPNRRRASTVWASPAPSATGNGASEPEGTDFEIIVKDLTTNSSATSKVVQLDTDIPHDRLTAGRKEDMKRSKFEMEQLIASPGSLPKPLTADQREDAIRSILPTATYQMLSRVPLALLKAQSSEGQNLRRNLARGATVVFVSAGYPGKRFTFEKAAAMGIKCVVIEHPGSWAEGLVEAGIIAKFLPVDMSQSSDAIFQDCLSLIKGLGEDGKTGPADGIATFVELSVPLVVRLTEVLGLPGHRPASVDAARNKHATRAALKAAGLPTPRNALIRSPQELEAAGACVQFPAVLKPSSGAASLGVKKVLSMEELRSSYNEIVAELSSLVISSGALVKGTGDANDIKAEKNVDLTVLLEQFLDGDEVDVDIVMSDGQWVYAAVTDNGPTLEPYFNETWACSPSLLPKEKQVGLKELAIKSLQALNFTAGVFHVELKYTSTGPQLIEVNARMGGGPVRESNLLTWGVDLVEETLFACLGIPARPAVPKQPLKSLAYEFINAKKSGKVVDLRGVEALLKHEGVLLSKPLVAPGEQVVGPEEGLPTWLCELLVTRRSAHEALEYLHALAKEEPVKVE